MVSNSEAFKSITCRHCGEAQEFVGPLFKRCTSCQAAIWHNEKLVRRVGSEKSPTQEPFTLKEAEVPERKRNHWYVYINDCDDAGTYHNYVGYTGHHPYRRLYQHARGAKVASRESRKGHTVGLRYFEGPFPDEDSAKTRETELARMLRMSGELGVIDGGGKSDFELVRKNKMTAKDGPREEAQLVHELIQIVAEKRILESKEKQLRKKLEKWCEAHPDQRRFADSRTGGSVRVNSRPIYEYDLAGFRIDHPGYINELIDAGTIGIKGRTALTKSSAKAAAEELQRSYEQITKTVQLTVKLK